MNLREVKVEQGTPEWHDARLGMLTASVIGTIITPSTKKPAANMQARALAATLAAERINRWGDESYYSDDMMRGHLGEPEAINAYTAHTGATVRVTGLLVRDFDGFSIGYSPDGLVRDEGQVEVKSPRAKEHVRTVIADAVPEQYVAQVQAGLLVSGRQWCDFLSYCGGMRLFPKRVEPDPEWHEALLEAAATFEAAVEQMVTTYHERTLGLPMTERLTYHDLSLEF